MNIENKMNDIDPPSSSSSLSTSINNRFQLTPLEKEKYFGFEGEDSFNERLKYLAINRHKTNNSKNNENNSRERRERKRNIVNNCPMNIQINESIKESKKKTIKKKEFLMSPLTPLAASPTRLREVVKNSKSMDNVSSFLTEYPLVEGDEHKGDEHSMDDNSIDSGDDLMLANSKVNMKLISKQNKTKKELDDEISLQRSIQEVEDCEDLQLITDQLSIIGDQIKDGGILRGIITENKNIKARLIHRRTRHTIDNSRFDDDISILSNDTFNSTGYSLRSIDDDNLSIQGIREIEDKVDEIYISTFNRPASARSKYINSCIKKNLLPRKNLIIRKKESNIISLKKMGMGDERCVIFAESIIDMPNIERLDLTDNNLHNIGIIAITKAVTKLPNFLELNLSLNTIEMEAATALQTLISSPNCKIERLILKNSNLDDYECERLFRNISENNKSLTDIDISYNLLGESEILNTVNPGLTTGGEAVANLLRNENCKLKKLNLGWNLVRLNSAIDLAYAIGSNSSLTYLDLSYNGIGSEGGEILGNSIVNNKNLQTLLLASNAIGNQACFTICIGILENLSITKVVLDGNPIGDEGARAAMHVAVNGGDRCCISIVNCNIDITNISQKVFNFHNPSGEYTLNLSKPYERAIAINLLQYSACHETIFISKIEYDKQLLDLEQKAIDITNDLDDSTKNIVKELIIWIDTAKDIKTVVSIFEKYDTRKRNKIDVSDLTKLLRSVNLDLSKEYIDETMEFYDIEKSGLITQDEIIHFLLTNANKAKIELKTLVELPIMVIKGSNERYIPPETGILNIIVQQSLTKKNIFKLLSGNNSGYTKMALESTNFHKMMGYALKTSKLRLNEATVLFDNMYRESGKRVGTLSKILTQVALPQESRVLVSRVLNNDRDDLNKLKKTLGCALNPIFGNQNGYYNLDLSVESDRICIKTLLEINESEKSKSFLTNDAIGAKYDYCNDASQEGDLSCFRNSMFNRVKFSINTESINTLPFNGKLCFDFITSERPNITELCMDDLRCIKLLVICGLMGQDEEDWDNTLEKMKSWQKECDDNIVDDGNDHIYKASKVNAKEISEYMNIFYKKLPIRQDIYEKYVLLQQAQSEIDYLTVEKPKPIRRNSKLISKIGMFKKPEPIIEAITEEPERPISRAKSSLYSNDETSDVLKYTNGRTDDDEIEKLILLNKTEELESIKIAAEKIDKKNSKKSNKKNLKNDKDDNNKTKKKNAKKSENESVVVTNNLPNFTKDDKESRETTHEEETLTESKTTGSLVSTDGTEIFVVTSDINEDTDHILSQSTIIIEPLDLDNVTKLPGHISQPGSRAQSSRNKDKNNSIEGIVNSNNYGVKTGRKNQIVEEKISEKPKTNRYISHDSFIKKSEINGILFDFNQLNKSQNVKSSHKAQRVNDYIEQTFCRKILLVRQVALIVDKFEKLGSIVKLEFFSTHRVDMIINLFDRIIDIQNFDIILRLLNSFEKACLYCRLGWLNLFNPLRPDNCYELDLSRFEERRLLKMLLILQVKHFDKVEYLPDGNWVEKEFKWRRSLDKIENWKIPNDWNTEKGIPRRGVVFINYSSVLLSVLQKEKELEIAAKTEKEIITSDTSNEGAKNTVKDGKEEDIFNECKPNILLRKSLCNLTLINEQDFLTEKERVMLLSKITDRVKNDEDIVIDEFGNIMILVPDDLPGQNFMISNIGLWNFLCPKIRAETLEVGLLYDTEPKISEEELAMSII